MPKLWPFQNKPKPEDATEEHRISLPGLEVAISHKLKIVWVIDQNYTDDTYALEQLEKWIKEQGYFMYCVSVEHPATPPMGAKQ